MKSIAVFLLFLTIIIFFISSTFGLIGFEEYVESKNAKLTVVFDVDGVIVEKSTVLRYSIKQVTNSGIGSRQILAALISGEAIVFDFPVIGNVFVLPGYSLQSPETPTLIARACGISFSDFPRETALTDFQDALSSFSGVCDLPANALPAIIWFESPGDFHSARWLSLADITDYTSGRVRFSRAFLSGPVLPEDFKYSETILPILENSRGAATRVRDPQTGNEVTFPPRYLTTEEIP